MAQIKSGIRSLLELPAIYSCFQNILGASKYRRIIVEEYLKLEDGLSFLDVGCGPGDILSFISKDIEYIGFDFEPNYIESAIKKFGNKGTFLQADVNEYSFGEKKFDRIHISGVLHHLEDTEVERLMSNISRILTPNGKFICVENVFIPQQNPIAYKLITMDRGRNVRSEQGYRKLIENSFGVVCSEIRTDMLRIPYTHVVFTASL